MNLPHAFLISKLGLIPTLGIGIPTIAVNGSLFGPGFQIIDEILPKADPGNFPIIQALNLAVLICPPEPVVRKISPALILGHKTAVIQVPGQVPLLGPGGGAGHTNHQSQQCGPYPLAHPPHEIASIWFFLLD